MMPRFSVLEVVPLADYRASPDAYRLPLAHRPLSSGDMVVIVDEGAEDWVVVPFNWEEHGSSSGMALVDTAQNEPAIVIAKSIGADVRIWVLE
jgi:hypothetical protein